MVKGVKLAAVFLAALLVLAGAAVLFCSVRAVQTAEAEQAAAYGRYETLLRQIESSVLHVTEHGETVGLYNLTQLGLADQAIDRAETCFGEQDRMEPAAFAAQDRKTKLAWQEQAHRQVAAVVLDPADLDPTVVMADLERIDRTSAVDAYAFYQDGAYLIEPEAAGTELNMDRVATLLRLTLEGQIIDDTAPRTWSLEIADGDAYVRPEVTKEDDFDYAELLERDSAGLTVTVELLDQEETLEIAPLLRVDDRGLVSVDRDALEQIVSGWAETYDASYVPYVLDSFVEGPIRLDFLPVNYELNRAEMVSILEAQILALETGTVKAPFFCTRFGEPFAIADTYVEVDIDNQHMTYYVDGEVFVDTDVVTGYPYGNWTPPGMYRVQNIHEDQWLSGDDYHVFVEYWVGFHGAYGIHDASWRDIFGGKHYLTNGSHGCANTPTEPMRIIHANIEVGTPVLVHNERDPDEH